MDNGIFHYLMHVCSHITGDTTWQWEHRSVITSRGRLPWLFFPWANPSSAPGRRSGFLLAVTLLPSFAFWPHAEDLSAIYSMIILKEKTREAFLSVRRPALLWGFFLYPLFCRSFTVNRTNQNRSGLSISLPHLELGRFGLTFLKFHLTHFLKIIVFKIYLSVSVPPIMMTDHHQNSRRLCQA